MWPSLEFSSGTLQQSTLTLSMDITVELQMHTDFTNHKYAHTDPFPVHLLKYI